jgi:hypothetical protein
MSIHRNRHKTKTTVVYISNCNYKAHLIARFQRQFQAILALSPYTHLNKSRTEMILSEMGLQTDKGVIVAKHQMCWTQVACEVLPLHVLIQSGCVEEIGRAKLTPTMPHCSSTSSYCRHRRVTTTSIICPACSAVTRCHLFGTASTCPTAAAAS